MLSIKEYIKNVNPAAKEQQHMQTLLRSDFNIDIYDTELDAAGLYIAGPIDSPSSDLFKSPFVYQISAESGSFTINEEIKQSSPTLFQTSQKCLVELFTYLKRNLEIGESIELDIFQLGDEFEWQERQYIRVKR